MSVDTHVYSELTRFPLFGYFCVERDGLETVLVRIESDGCWTFPINTEFNPCDQTVVEAIDTAVGDFCKKSGLLGREELLASGLEPPIIRNVLIGPSPAEEDVVPEARLGFFFKIRLNDQSKHSNPDYVWKSKGSLFSDRKGCVDKKQLDAINRDFKYARFGFKVLECVDMLVFRLRNDQVEFLMLKREAPGEVIGWEYPKGGIQFHETLREGALRELEEETGVTSYIYRGYLGCQTVDVRERERYDYDTLRVHGLTFLFTGAEDTIRPSREGRAVEGLRTPEWVSREEAREKVWMESYGPEFFDRWKKQQDKILDGLIL